MTNKLTLTEQEELFAKDCKLINLKYEYNGYTGDEKWAIIVYDVLKRPTARKN